MKNLLRRLFLIIIFIIYTESKKRRIKIDYLSPYHTHEGKCPDNPKEASKIFCLPFKHITFDYFFSRKFLDETIKEAEKWFHENPFHNIFHRLEYVVKPNGDKNHIGVFAKEVIEQNRPIYLFNEYDNFGFSNITKNDFDYFSKIEEHQSYPKIQYQRYDLELVHALLYHFYWAEMSKYRHVFRLLPPKPDVPMFTLTHYELKLLEGDQIFEYIVNYREMVYNAYREFLKYVKEAWTEDERESYFKFDEVPYDDFIYTYFVRSQFSFEDKSIKNETHLYIPVGLLTFQQQWEESKLKIRAQMNREKNQTETFLIAEEAIEKDEEIKIQIHESISPFKQDEVNFKFMLHFGILPEENEKDCIDINMIDPLLGKDYGVPHIACISLYNERLLMYQAMGNLMNMEQAEYDACKEKAKINNLHYATPEQEKKFIFDVCKHPDWKKLKIWDMALEDIDDKIVMYRKKIKKAEKYLDFRKKHKLSAVNADLIYKYLLQRKNLLKQIKYELEGIMAHPKRYVTEKTNLFTEDPLKEHEKKQEEKKAKEKEEEEERKKQEEEKQKLLKEEKLKQEEVKKNDFQVEDL